MFDVLTIYDGIFNEASKNMLQSGNALEFSKNEFLFSVKGDPNCCNILDLARLDNKEFLFLTYVLLLQRLPDDYAHHCWEKSLSLPKEDFQNLLVDAILKSHEFELKKVNIQYNYTAVSSEVVSVKAPDLVNYKYEKLSKTFIYKIYSHMPIKTRIFIRKLMRMDTI